MYRWVPGKRTRVQTEPAPSDYVRPLEFDRIREGQNPPHRPIGSCGPLYKGHSKKWDNKISLNAVAVQCPGCLKNALDAYFKINPNYFLELWPTKK